MKESNQHTCPKCAASIPDEAPGGLCPKCALEGVATVSGTTPGGRKSPFPPISEIAPHFPDLEILELIGAGGMGAVYKARQPQLDRFVALKILSHDLAGDPAFVERFDREAKVLGRLSHPNIVGIHDFGTAGPYCFLTMEYVDGVNLRQAMRAGRFTPTEALAMAQHICAALKFAHEEGILHRDIKPENILIDSKGRVKIADFGIAKLVGDDRQHDVTLTLQGSVLGSPHYMAPEQIETPGDVDQRADIYSLGVVLYEMLTGGLPIGRFALPSEKAAMDARIDEIVLRTLAKERQARFQTAQEVSTQVDYVTKSPAPVANTSAPARMESGMARFSLVSALLTSISIIFGIIVAYLFSSYGDIEIVIRKIGAGWALFNLVVTLGTAAGGLLLGASALGEIRKSGGKKDGLIFAIFATVVWPILFFLGLAMIYMRMRFEMAGVGVGLGWIGLTLLLTVPMASLLMGRALYRWAKGVENKDGTRFHPRLARPLLVVITLAVFVPALLTEIAARISPSSGGSRVSEYEASAEGAMNEMEEGGVTWDWTNGLPEVNFLFLVNPNQKVEFQLIRSRINDPGTPLQTFDIKGVSDDRDDGNVSIGHRLFIGNANTYSSKNPFGLAAVIQGYETESGVLDMDFSRWEFEEELPRALDDEEGATEVLIATKDKENPEIAEQLVLRTVVTAVR